MGHLYHPTPPEAAFPVRSGNKILPLIDGIPFFSRLLEAMRTAKHSLWFVVSFLHDDFRFPDGTLFWDALDECHERGVDVRVLFWRNPHFFNTTRLFLGDEADLAFLRTRNTGWKARWDSSGKFYDHCHHQKFWVLDAGAPSEVGFVGGMVFGKSTVDDSRHRKPWSRHDVCVEVQGPCLRDLANNFIQRWNQVTTNPDNPTHWPSSELCNDLSLSDVSSQTTLADGISAQITRTMQAHRWTGFPDSPSAFPIEHGENSIFEQYLHAFEQAKEWIYIENQHPGDGRLLEALERAARRGVQILYVVPGQPMAAIAHEKAKALRWLAHPTEEAPRYLRAFSALQRLSSEPNFTLATLARAENPVAEIYVHAKVCFVDGIWGTCGSANLVDLSFDRNHTELNISFWDETLVATFVRKLWAEHCQQTFGEKSLSSALQQVVQLARNNRSLRDKGQSWPGHLCAVDSAAYPEQS